MNITEEKTGDLTATLKLEVSEADYAEQYERELKSHRRQASMPGFRPGNVPIGIIRKKYGTPILLEEVNKLVSETLNKHIKDNNMDLLGYPMANAEKEQQDFSTQKDFNFYFDIAYAPKIKIKLSEYEATDFFKIKVDDDKINEQINEIRKRNGKLAEQDVVENEDMIHVNIAELDDEGNIKENGITKSTMILTSFVKKQEVKDQILGSKLGDIVVFNPLEATENAVETASMLGITKEEAENLHGNFQFEITKIERNTPAELGEELYKGAFPNDDIKTEEEFRTRVSEEVSKIYDTESNRLFARHAMDKLFADTEVNLPDEFLKKWLYYSNEGKISMEEIESNYTGYHKAMKMELIENKLIKLNAALRVTEEDIKGEIKNYFKGYFLPNVDASEGEDPAMAEQLDQIAENYLQKNKEETKRIYDDLFSRRLANYLKSEMPLEEKEVSYDEFVEEINKFNVSDHDHNHDHDHDHDHGSDEEESK